MRLDFPDLTATLSTEAIVLCSGKPLHVLSSAVVGGGFARVHYILSRHVHKDYCHPDPSADLQAFARGCGIQGAFVGQMTAVPMHKARAVTWRRELITVTSVVTAGCGNATIPGCSPPALPGPGTINIVLLVDAHLSPAAMVNAVITATEVKTQVCMARGIRTPEGWLATGTSTDAVVIACTGRGDVLSYAGPVTELGWCIGRSVRAALQETLE